MITECGTRSDYMEGRCDAGGRCGGGGHCECDDYHSHNVPAASEHTHYMAGYHHTTSNNDEVRDVHSEGDICNNSHGGDDYHHYQHALGRKNSLNEHSYAFGLQLPCRTPCDEEMQHLLSKPVSLTHKQIGEHNLDGTRTDGLWLVRHGKVYDVNSLHRQLSEMVAINKGRLPEVCDIGDIINGNGEDDEDESISDILSTYDLFSAYIDPMERVSYNNIWKCLPSLELSEEQIKEALEASYVAHYKELSDEEAQDEFRQEVFMLRCDIQREVLKPPLVTLLDTLERAMVIPNSTIPLNSDRNLDPFPLPRGVYSEDLRSWLQTWDCFDTAVDDDLISRDRCYDVILESEAEDIFLGSLRPYCDEYELDHEIEGEAAWQVLEENVVSTDECTDEQQETLDKRAKRQITDKSKKDRRLKLAGYFAEKYQKEWDYSHFPESMEQDWRNFECLCKENDH